MKLKNLLSLVVAIVHLLRSTFKSRSDLVLENLVLRQQVLTLKKRNFRPRLAWTDRMFWVCLSRIWSHWRRFLIIVKPETVIRWHREAFRRHWRSISNVDKTPGRPRTHQEIRDLIRRMVRENPTWGAPRIHGELLKLGFRISERTVSRYLPRRESSGTASMLRLALLIFGMRPSGRGHFVRLRANKARTEA